MKIVILDAYTANPGDLSWASVEALGTAAIYNRTMPELTIGRIGDAEAVLTNKVLITRKVIESCPSIRYIGVLSTGCNVIDRAAAAEHGITISNIPAYSTDSVAQMTMALLLEICCHAGHHSDAVREGRWSECQDFCFWDYPLIELSGKTFGVIGYGNIGQRVAELAQAFRMDVLVFTHRPESVRETEHCQYAPLDMLLEHSDIISLHCPLTGENKEIIRKDTISRMKDGAIVLNASRGGLVCDADTADALNSGKLAAFAADTASVEPIPAANPLLTAQNCIITPHIAWASKEARARLIDIAAGNLKAFQEGHPRNTII